MRNAKSSVNKFSKGVALFSVSQGKPGMLLKKNVNNPKGGGSGMVISIEDDLGNDTSLKQLSDTFRPIRWRRVRFSLPSFRALRELSGCFQEVDFGTVEKGLLKN